MLELNPTFSFFFFFNLSKKRAKRGREKKDANCYTGSITNLIKNIIYIKFKKKKGFKLKE